MGALMDEETDMSRELKLIEALARAAYNRGYEAGYNVAIDAATALVNKTIDDILAKGKPALLKPQAG
jgi:hypothetical protein